MAPVQKISQRLTHNSIRSWEYGKSQYNYKKSPDISSSNLSGITNKKSGSDKPKSCITGTPSSFATKGFG
jgi:hypothetical protein